MNSASDSLLAREIKQTRGFESPEQEVYLNLERTANVLSFDVTQWMAGFDLTPTQYNALRILRGSHPGSLPCGEVRSRMVTQDTDITRLLDRLEKRGLVQRVRDTNDRRVVNASITDAGLALLATMDEPVRQFVKRKFAHMTQEQLAKLSQLLEAVRSV